MRAGGFQNVLLFAVAGLLAAWAVSATDLGRAVEHRVYDSFVRARSHQGKGPQLDNRLLIVEIDEKSRQAHKAPLALWLPLYGQALDVAYSHGAALVGFDIIPTYAPRESLLPFAQPILAYPEKIVMAEFYDLDTRILVRPEQGIRALVGDQNLALSNLLMDEDGVCRRQRLGDWQIEDTGHPFFATLLLEKLDHQVASDKEEIYINFAGPAGTMPSVSFSDVLQWQESQESQKLRSLFEGKLVLIGGTAKADQDFVVTPFPSVDTMPGIETHANILNTLLQRDWLEVKPAWWVLAVLLIPLAWVSLKKPLLISTPVCIVLSVSWVIGAYVAFLGGAIVEPKGVAVVGFLATYVGGYFYRFSTVDKEKRRIRSVFGKYVSPDVMEAMLEFPEDHRPELARRQRVTVMFSDINEFSTACEKLEPEEVTRRLNAYFGEMTNIIYGHQGTIIRFIGDEFMVLFGAPKANEKSEEQAVLSAVRMVERLNQLKAADKTGTEGFYEVKIGIHVGDMILTSIGNELRSDYNCIGDSTNMAARVLSLTKPLGATVLISEDVKVRVEQHPELDFKDLGVHPVKGRKGEMRVFEAFLKGPLKNSI